MPVFARAPHHSRRNRTMGCKVSSANDEGKPSITVTPGQAAVLVTDHD
jgi:hypothetical protein